MSWGNKPEDRNVIENVFEAILWSGRWSILLAVIGGMITSIGMFYIAAVDVYYLVQLVLDYFTISDLHAREVLRAQVVGHAVEVIDGFLLAIVLLIFSYGIYELYVSKIVRAYGTNTAKHLLSINNLDDLKTRLGKVILMILVVKFFEEAVSMSFISMQDLMLFSVAIILIGLTLFMNQMVEYVVHSRRSSDRDGERKSSSGADQRRSSVD